MQQIQTELETTYRELTRLELANTEDFELVWTKNSANLLQEVAVRTSAEFTTTGDAVS